MKREDYYKLAELLNEFRKEYKNPDIPFDKQHYEEHIKYNLISSVIDIISELAECKGDESE